MTKLEATPLKPGKWFVRPAGQLGTCGWHPEPWEGRFVSARTASLAVAKVIKSY